MSTPGPDERQHFAALATALTSKLGADRVYAYGKVPGSDGNAGTLPPIYVLLAVERRFAPESRQGRAGRSGWRVTTRYVGRSVAEAGWAALQVQKALDEVRVTIDGHASTPVTFESQESIDPDNGRFSGLTSWTYAL